MMYSRVLLHRKTDSMPLGSRSRQATESSLHPPKDSRT